MHLRMPSEPLSLRPSVRRRLFEARERDSQGWPCGNAVERLTTPTAVAEWHADVEVLIQCGIERCEAVPCFGTALSAFDYTSATIFPFENRCHPAGGGFLRPGSSRP